MNDDKDAEADVVVSAWPRQRLKGPACECKSLRRASDEEACVCRGFEDGGHTGVSFYQMYGSNHPENVFSGVKLPNRMLNGKIKFVVY